MFHIALFEPEIPPNTGNIIRLSANTGCQLHLIQPYAFELDDKRLRRAGLDYHEFANIQEHANYECFIAALQPEQRVFAMTTKGSRGHHTIEYRQDDVFLFGPESRGLPDTILDCMPTEQRIRIPMLPERRSLNLSNSVAITIFEAWRQHDYLGSATNNT